MNLAIKLLTGGRPLSANPWECCCQPPPGGLEKTVDSIVIANGMSFDKVASTGNSPVSTPFTELTDISTEEHQSLPSSGSHSSLGVDPRNLDAVPVEYETIVAKEKRGEDFGIELEQLALGTACRVSGIHRDGLVEEYNAYAEPAKQVKVGDFLVELNGQRGDSQQMVDELITADRLHMKFKRSVLFNVLIEKPAGQSAGLGLKQYSDTTLLITEVQIGPVRTWNLENEDKMVCASDRIVGINGKVCKGEQLLATLETCERCTVQVARPCSVGGMITCMTLAS